MANNGLDIAPPPARKQPAVSDKPVKAATTPAKFKKQAETEMVQFNKRVTRRTADGYEMLAIKTRKKVPELLTEALVLLEEKYGKI